MNSRQKLSQELVSQPTPLKYLDIIRGVSIWVKHDYCNNRLVQGNKLRKLKYNLIYALENDYQSLATFGGAYSNHLFSVAAAGKLLNIPTVGFVRGQELANPNKWNSVLQRCSKMGMQLHFISRSDYREKYNATVVKNILTQHPKCYEIPEGGSNNLAIKGISEVITEIVEEVEKYDFDMIFTACGTGGTAAGLIDGVYQHNLKSKVVGIPVLKGAEFISDEIKSFSKHYQQVNWDLNLLYSFGGYGRFNQYLLNFMDKIQQNYNIRLDPVYTGKLFYGVFDYLKNRDEQKGKISKVIIYHSGGLTLFPDYIF